MRLVALFIISTIVSCQLYSQEPRSGAIEYSNTRGFIEKSDSKKRMVTPLKWVMGSFMYVYQNVISDHYLSRCAYHPSCSNFSKYAIKEFGWLKGVFLTADRIQRCNTLSLSQEPNELRISMYSYFDPPSRYKKHDQ